MNPELKAIQDEILATTKGLFDGLNGTVEEQKGKLISLQRLVDEIYVEHTRPDRPQRKDLGGLEGYVTPGQRLVAEPDLVKDFNRTGRLRLIVGKLHPSFEEKSLIDSAALGFSTPGILGSQRIEDGILPAPRRRLTVRDLLRARTVDQAQIEFIKENVFTNNASPQAEGEVKAESTITFLPGSERIRTLAHFCHLTRQSMDDLPELRRFVDQTLIYGLKLKEETELLSGDDLGDHLNGIIPQATAYAGTYNVGGDTRIDRLNWAILELEVNDEMPNGIVLNPIDHRRILAIKDETNGANTGNYVVGDPLGGVLQVNTLWGRPVVSTNSIAVGKFLVGDFSRAIIGDREDATVDISYEHADNFIRNRVTLLCEERLALAVTRPSAFRYGSF